MRIALCLLASLVLACEHQNDVERRLDDSEQQRVVVAALSTLFAKYIEDDIALVVVDEFYLDWYFKDRAVLERSQLGNELLTIDSDLLDDFYEKNPSSESVWGNLEKLVNVIFVSPEEIDALYNQKNLRTGKTGVERFQAKFPHSPGAITVSKVGFNAKRDKAMLCIGTPNGPGTIFVLHRNDGVWELRHSHSIPAGWVS